MTDWVRINRDKNLLMIFAKYKKGSNKKIIAFVKKNKVIYNAILAYIVIYLIKIDKLFYYTFSSRF
ncbi:hypothetical protein PMARG_ME00264 [Candidatus Mikella endobia]|uniref:Uncharacterized protein n=1 Tax=Candidatus Mikella endobia TaxID=1778264 RepID=A0A143WQH9_9ENTR|nr:hypothetical protein PMARG_ME00264 [Candidatus Mikella endobia]